MGLLWRALAAIDFVVAVPVYALAPRDARQRWCQPGTVTRNIAASEEVSGLLEPGRRALVLDIGGGAAALQERLAADPRVKVVTLDLDLGVLRQGMARMKAPALVCADGTRMPFADGAVDVVVMVHSLEHIPSQNRDALASEIKRVSRRGVVILGPAGDAATELSHRFIERLQALGVDVPRYAREHVEFSIPSPEWLAATFPGCRLVPRRNLEVELSTIMIEHTPVIRWFAGYNNNRQAEQNQRPPFVEYTMTWMKHGA